MLELKLAIDSIPIKQHKQYFGIICSVDLKIIEKGVLNAVS